MRNPIPKTAVVVIAAAILLCGATAASPAPASKVIELFTSQGCSSCPPADKLAAKLAREPGTVVISMPVDYWDYLGWKDSFASPAYTARQKAYAKARGDMQVYTPQVVVDGAGFAVGSEPDAIAAAARASKAPDVAIAATQTGGTLRVEVGAGQGAAAVWLVPVLSSATVAIGRGENDGKTVTYTNVARRLDKLGAWNGAPRQFDIPAADIRRGGADGAAILLQADTSGLPGAILGAAIVRLK